VIGTKVYLGKPGLIVITQAYNDVVAIFQGVFQGFNIESIGNGGEDQFELTKLSSSSWALVD